MELPLSFYNGTRLTSAELEAMELDPPVFHGMSLEEVQAINQRLCELIVYDDAYFARSLAAKNDVPFAM